ncbi:MAG: hypothetical protein RDU13_02120 [Elusimicrobiales bacterium]|nr:hypothetical protein [Elusimicrobiales bacterium]
MRGKIAGLARRAGRGQMAIVMVLVILLFLLIMIPVIEMFVRNEAVWTVKEKKNTTAFHLAEAGVDRAYWKLIEKQDNFKDITEGAVIPGYADDVEYADIEGGVYKINMTVGDTNTKVQVIATGKDVSSKEFRAIKAVFSKAAIDAALQAPSISGAGNANIHWGPVMSMSGMNLAGGANELYPRKYARGAITASGGYPDRDTDPNAPNKGPYTNNVKTEWWSYNEPPGVPDILTPDTSHYASLAQAQGYYYPNASYTMNNVVDTVCTVGANPKVRFFQGNVTFGGSKYFCGILIVMGNLTFSSGGRRPEGEVTVTPPANAWQEYQLNVPVHSGASSGGAMDSWTYEAAGVHPGACGGGPHGDTAAVDEYPGDAGYHTVSDYNFYTCRVASGHCGLGNNATAGRRELSFKGYIYAANGFTGSGSTRIFGAVHVAQGAAFSGGGMDIFYDDNLNVRFLNDNIRRVSWHEVRPTEF